MTSGYRMRSTILARSKSNVLDILRKHVNSEKTKLKKTKKVFGNSQTKIRRRSCKSPLNGLRLKDTSEDAGRLLQCDDVRHPYIRYGPGDLL